MVVDHGETTTALLREPERRRRLVRACAAISGDRSAAEDLAQETLLEAWRHAHKLHDPGGVDRWLAAIARNVCLRWARRQGRDAARLAPLDAEMPLTSTVDLEAELERSELVRLIDRALGLLPAGTRDVLIQRYGDGSSQAEIADRLGVSEDAVSMRVTRGKAALRRVLTSDLRHEAAAEGLLQLSDAGWVETRVWCNQCGRRKLLVRREAAPASISFRCPCCQPEEGGLAVDLRLDNPVFAGLTRDLVRPAAILRRLGEWSGQYFDTRRQDAACTRCGRPVPLRPHVRDDAAADANALGLLARCAACGEETWSSIVALALARPELRAFRREHPRVRTAPFSEVDSGGVDAVVVRCENALGSARADVVFARDTLHVLAVHGATG